jgi:hypothetical protein
LSILPTKTIFGEDETRRRNRTRIAQWKQNNEKESGSEDSVKLYVAPPVRMDELSNYALLVYQIKLLPPFPPPRRLFIIIIWPACRKVSENKCAPHIFSFPRIQIGRRNYTIWTAPKMRRLKPLRVGIGYTYREDVGFFS